MDVRYDPIFITTPSGFSLPVDRILRIVHGVHEVIIHVEGWEKEYTCHVEENPEVHAWWVQKVIPALSYDFGPAEEVKEPVHPGQIVLGILKDGDNDIVPETLHEKLGVSGEELEKFLSGLSSVDVELAQALSTGLGGSPQMWLDLQAKYDQAKTQTCVEA